jgi:hypothetical protein
VPDGLAAALEEVDAAEPDDDVADDDDVDELFSPPPQPAAVAQTSTAATAKPAADVRIMFILTLVAVTAIYTPAAAPCAALTSNF